MAASPVEPSAPTSTPVLGSTSAPASSSSAVPPSPPDRQDGVAALADPDVRPPWIEPSWLVLPLALVPLIAVPALLLLRHFAPPRGQHRRR